MRFRQFVENTIGAYKSIRIEMPLEREVMVLYELFQKEGLDLVVVGGAVRDYLYHLLKVFNKNGYDFFALPHDERNRLVEEFSGELRQFKAKDIDLATDATPAQKKKILSSPEAQKAKITWLELGEAFGIIVAQVPSGGKLKQYEIATYREDSKEGDGRRPDKVTFSTRSADVRRRDLTINALMYDIDTKEIRDYNDGQGIEDIRSNTVNTVGDPFERFEEDRLRALRTIRFFTRYNDGGPEELEKNPRLAGALRHFNQLPGISEERIKQEFTAGLQQAKSLTNYLKIYKHFGLFDRMFPGLNVTRNIDRLRILERDPNNHRNPRLVLAWLLKDNHPNAVQQAIMNLKFPDAGGVGHEHKISRHVPFLISLLNFDPKDVAQYAKVRDNMCAKAPHMPGTSRKDHALEILAWSNLAGLDQNLMSKFVQFELSVKGDDPELQKFKGPALGKAIAEKEAKLFYTMIQ